MDCLYSLPPSPHSHLPTYWTLPHRPPCLPCHSHCWRELYSRPAGGTLGCTCPACPPTCPVPLDGGQGHGASPASSSACCPSILSASIHISFYTNNYWAVRLPAAAPCLGPTGDPTFFLTGRKDSQGRWSLTSHMHATLYTNLSAALHAINLFYGDTIARSSWGQTMQMPVYH